DLLQRLDAVGRGLAQRRGDISAHRRLSAAWPPRRRTPCPVASPPRAGRPRSIAPMAHTIAVLSQKGGTGKTTAVRTLTDVFRRRGVHTLAVDLDPQGNLSDYFGHVADVEPTIADALC